MTMEAARERARVRGEVARLEAELAKAGAERDWLAEQLAEMMVCPDDGCDEVCETDETARDCWQRAAEKATTKPKEVTT